MFGRPRCREWTPLATQQLRLRSLIQIVGYNIRPPEWCMSPCSFYLTLHHTAMSAPFYTSERISSPHPKWKEIDSETTQRMSSTNVVIRIWCHILHSSKDIDEKYERPQDTVIQTWGVYFTGLRYIGANSALNFTSDCFKSNTLVFQMHGGYFCSYKSLKLDIMPPENEMEHGSLSSDSSSRTNLSRIVLDPKFIQSHKLIKGSRSISPNKFFRKEEKEYSKSNSPVERNFRQNFPKIKSSASLNIGQSQRDSYYSKTDENNDRKATDPNQIYEHSPDDADVKEFTASDIFCDNLSKNASSEELSASKIDLSETAENYDLRNESDGTPKYRYLALSFLKSEIRPSYNATKLQKLHLLQYSIKKKQEAVNEIKERIYQKSALSTEKWPILEDSESKLKAKTRSQKSLFSPDETECIDKECRQYAGTKNGRITESRPPVLNGPRLTLKLNDLLSFKAKPSPFQRAEHVRLTKQLEVLRFKRIILVDERDNKLANIRRLKEKHAKLSEENQDVGLELMQNYHSLSRRNEALRETRQSYDALLELAARSHASLARRRCELLMQLQQIFYIDQKDESTWTICGVPLPICDDDSPRSASPVADSVAAGYVAQATCLTAALLNQPLRYKISLLGSASKILDITPDLSDPNIPLFVRGGDLTLFRYGLFLLNKCIVQLLWGRGLPVPDLRPTLANLRVLLSKPTNLSDTSKLFGTYKWLADNKCPRTQSLRSMVASERGKYRQFNRFKDAVDGQSPQSVMNLRRHRHSKSVGSCRDDQELPAFDASTTSIMGSEPDIYNTKLTQANSTDAPTNLKAHSSDSEISNIAIKQKFNDGPDGKVVFTLGCDESIDLESEKLVRISTNNGDGADLCLKDNVIKICSEIEDFCSGSVDFEADKNYVPEGFDVAKHIEAMIVTNRERKSVTEPEDIVSVCENCEKNSDSACDLSCVESVSDVIVIQSAEAMLDTGQSEAIDEKDIVEEA